MQYRWGGEQHKRSRVSTGLSAASAAAPATEVPLSLIQKKPKQYRWGGTALFFGKNAKASFAFLPKNKAAPFGSGFGSY
jgi:cell wall-associated NlpC family hydrolase